MDTFNPPATDFVAQGYKSTISDTKSPNSKFGSLYVQKEAFEQNHAAEKFIQELDASAKKQFIQKEQELNQFMTRGSFGLSVDRDYGINESILRGNNALGGKTLGNEKLISSYASSNQERNNQPYSPNMGGIKQEETISRYLVEMKNIDSQSRGRDTILRIKTQSPSPLKSSQNAEKGSYERSSKFDTNQHIPTFVNQSIYQSNQHPANDKYITNQEYAFQGKTTSQQQLRNFDTLFQNENYENKNHQNVIDNQHYMKKIQSNQALHYQQKKNFENDIQYLNQKKDIYEQNILNVNYSTNMVERQNLIKITDQLQNYQSLRQPSNEKLQKNTPISLSQNNLFNQNAFESNKSRNDIVNNLRSTPQIKSHNENTLFNCNEFQANINSQDVFQKDQYSQDINSSMALNRRIQKLKNEIHPAQQMFSPTEHDHNLEAQLSKAQANSNHLISKSRSRSPLSASELSQLYVETKRTRSNATSLQLVPQSEIQKTSTTFRSQSKTKSYQTNEIKQAIPQANNLNQTLKENFNIKDFIKQNNTNQKQLNHDNYSKLSNQFQEQQVNIENEQTKNIMENNNIFNQTNKQSKERLQIQNQRSQRHQSQNEQRIISVNKRFDSAFQKRRQSDSKGKSSSLRTRNPFQMNNTSDRSLTKIPLNNQKAARTLSKKSNLKIFESQSQLLKSQIESTNPNSQKQVNFKDQKSASEIIYIENKNVGVQQTSLQDSQQTLVNLDIFYQDIIKKERIEFKQILKSQAIIARSDAEAKLRKYIQNADQKYQKINELKRSLKFIKNNNEKLRGDWQKIQLQLQKSQHFLSQSREENQILKTQLDDQWQKFDDEKDLIKKVTKIEVEKEKDLQSKILEDQIIQTQKKYEEILSKCEQLQQLEQKLQQNENEKINLTHSKDQLQANFEKLEEENQKLKIELANSQAAQMANLKNQYNEMKKKYKDLEKQSKESSIEQIKNKNIIELENLAEDEFDDFKKIQQKNQSSAKIQNEGGNNISQNDFDSKHLKNQQQNKYIKLKNIGKQKYKNQSDQSHSPNNNQSKKDEIWKKRCQILADKYFNIIKDMKKSIQKLKQNSLNQIEQLKIELAQSFTSQLNKFIEDQQRNQIVNKYEMKSNSLSIQPDISQNENKKKLMNNSKQRSSQPTPGFQSREDLNQVQSINERLLGKINQTNNCSSTNLISNNQDFANDQSQILVENQRVQDKYYSNYEIPEGLHASEKEQASENINQKYKYDDKNQFYHFDLDQNHHDRINSGPYLSNFGKYFYRVNDQIRTASNSLTNNDQLQPYAQKQRNDHSSSQSNSNSRGRTITQVAIVNGSQHYIASLRNKGNSQYDNNTLPSKRFAQNQISSSYNSNQVALSNQRSHASQISVSQSIGGYAVGNKNTHQSQIQPQILISPNSKVGSSYQKERQLSNQFQQSEQNENDLNQNTIQLNAQTKSSAQPPQSIHQLYPINSETFSEVNREIDAIKNIGSSIMSTLNQDQHFNQTYQDKNIKSQNNQNMDNNLLPSQKQHYISFQKKQSSEQKNYEILNQSNMEKYQNYNQKENLIGKEKKTNKNNKNQKEMKKQNKENIKEQKQKYIKRSSSQKLLELKRAAQKQKDELSKSENQYSQKSGFKRSLSEMKGKKQTDEKKSFTSSYQIQKSNVSIELSKSKSRKKNQNSKIIKNLYGKRQVSRSTLNKNSKSLKSKVSGNNIKKGTYSSKGSMSSKSKESRSIKRSENSFFLNQSQKHADLSTIVEIQGNNNKNIDTNHIFKQPNQNYEFANNLIKQNTYNESERLTEKQAYDSMRINKKSILQSADLHAKHLSGSQIQASHKQMFSNQESHHKTQNQISEFEKLNAEIQKSINSLKQLSKKQAYTGYIDIDESNAGYTSQTNSVPKKADSFSNNKTFVSQSSNQKKLIQNNLSKISHY